MAATVWQHFGNVHAYAEPFAGTAAVLLARPDTHRWWNRAEVLGDTDGMVVNFHRAAATAPDRVAAAADHPVGEADLNARHQWLRHRRETLTAQLLADPHYCDPVAAGWWIWGLSAWIGAGFAHQDCRKTPMIHATHTGKGVHRLPTDITTADQVTAANTTNIHAMITAVGNRLRRVRTVCTSWQQTLTGAINVDGGQTAGVFLDPPYDPTTRKTGLYPTDHAKTHTAAAAWALDHGGDPQLRIAYCGYDDPGLGDRFDSAGWARHAWTANGGYANQGDPGSPGAANRERETIWFSPGCRSTPAQLHLI